MAKGWKCARCSTANDEGALNCTNCGLIRGGVVVSGSYVPPPVSPAPAYTPAPNELMPSSHPAPAMDVAPMDAAPMDAAPMDAAPTAETGAGGGPVGVPYSEGWRTSAPAPTPLWRRIPIRLVIFAVLIGGGAIGGWYFNANRSGSGEITKGGDLTSSDLRVGDCWDLKDPAADQIGDVTARTCTEEHEYEVFYVGSMPGNAYPTEDVFGTYVADNCKPAFDAFVGKAYEDSDLDIFWLYPTTDGWKSGDKTIECSVYHPRIHRLTASMKGSAQ